MSSIKYLNKKISKELYGLRDIEYESFVDLLADIKCKTSVDARQLDILIKLDFFSEFGEINTLLATNNIFDLFYGRKTLKVTEVNTLKLSDEQIEALGGIKTEKQVKGINILKMIKLLCENREFAKTTVLDKINYEKECLGYIDIKMPEVSEKYAYVLEVNKKYSNKTIKLYRLKSGEIDAVKVKSRTYDKSPIEEGMIIKIIEAAEERRWKKEGDDWIRIDETETILYKWSNVQC